MRSVISEINNSANIYHAFISKAEGFFVSCNPFKSILTFVPSERSLEKTVKSIDSMIGGVLG